MYFPGSLQIIVTVMHCTVLIATERSYVELSTGILIFYEVVKRTFTSAGSPGQLLYVTRYVYVMGFRLLFIFRKKWSWLCLRQMVSDRVSDNVIFWVGKG